MTVDAHGEAKTGAQGAEAGGEDDGPDPIPLTDAWPLAVREILSFERALPGIKLDAKCVQCWGFVQRILGRPARLLPQTI